MRVFFAYNRKGNHPLPSGLFNLRIALRAFLSSNPLRPTIGAHPGNPTDIHLCLVDHYEPQVGRPPKALAQERVEDWLRRYPDIASKHRDADGCHPPHSFFYPYDEYDEWEFSHIAELCDAGWGELEIHLHHWNDTSDGLRQKLREAKRLWAEKGMLAAWPDGGPAFGFIHGNWALDNSRWKENPNPCGVNDEISILLEEGCYADFTFPAWQCSAQPRLMNRLYYAVDDPKRPKSYDWGERVKVSTTKSDLTMENTEHTEIKLSMENTKIVKGERRRDRSKLLMVPGVLAPYIERRGGRLRIAMDDSDLAASRRYHPSRLDRWVRAGIGVQGRPDRIFIKLHCHGAADANRAALLGEDLDALFSDAESRYNDGKRYRLHYVTAREMVNVIWETEG